MRVCGINGSAGSQRAAGRWYGAVWWQAGSGAGAGVQRGRVCGMRSGAVPQRRRVG